MRFVTTALLLTLSLSIVHGAEPNAQQEGPNQTSEASAPDVFEFDTSYHFSPTTSARNERAFLDAIRWSAGTEVRDKIRAAFEERSALERWQEIVAPDGLELGNVADALTAYWILNWVSANAAYSVYIDNAPVRRQLRAAFAEDPTFSRLSDQQKQTMAETYIRHFLSEREALNAAVRAKDIAALTAMAAASVSRFRSDMSVDLLALVPGPEGFTFKETATEDEAAVGED